MENNDKTKNQDGCDDNPNDCNCEGGCCPPKKNNILPRIIFTIIVLAAIGVITFKLVSKPAPATVKESCCPPQFSTGYDTARTATCDSTKGSSCCPK